MEKQLKNKVNLEWALLCSQSLVDTQSNNISLLNVIEQIKFEGEVKDKSKQFNTEGGEMIPVSMELVSRFRKLADPEEVLKLKCEVDFNDPDNKKLATFNNELLLDKGIQNLRMRFGIGGLKVTKSGLYNFSIKLKDSGKKTYTELTKVPLEVILVVK